MPQLDLFVFFGLYSSFFFFLSGMFVFCAYVAPFFIAFSKLSGNRIYYYYSSMIVSTDSLYRADIAFFSMSLCLCQALVIFYNSIESNRSIQCLDS
jgi:hypothetical protein